MRFKAARTPCITVSVEYRLAPESPIPGALADLLRAYEWAYEHVLEIDGEQSRVFVASASCGGALALGITLRLIEAGKRDRDKRYCRARALGFALGRSARGHAR